MEKAATAALSTTSKVKAREWTKKKENAAMSGDAMDAVSLFLSTLLSLSFDRFVVQSFKDKPTKSVDDIELTRTRLTHPKRLAMLLMAGAMPKVRGFGWLPSSQGSLMAVSRSPPRHPNCQVPRQVDHT
jgi:hypothetical protein